MMIDKTKSARVSLCLFIAIVIAFLTNTLTAEEINYCIECHSITHEEITEAFESDVHASAGLSCVDCHGGNASIDDESGMDPKWGYVGSPSVSTIPQFCAKCHSNPDYMHDFNPSLPTDQIDKYWSSTHGKSIRAGDEKAAHCASCHMTHSILPANDQRSSVYPENVPATCAKCHADVEYMSDYDIPTTQYEQYIDTLNVHGYALLVDNDVAAPACNDCHGNHGAGPPGVENVSLVCTQCHALNGKFFRNSPHMDGFEAVEVSQCAFCHQKNPSIDEPHARIHTIVKPNRNLVGNNEGAVCSQCHDEGDTGWETAGAISDLIDSLDTRLEFAKETIESVEKRGLEVSDARWELESEVLHARMELRTSVHHFNLDEYSLHYQKADTSLSKVLLAGSEAVKELGGRRIYFYVITVIIALMIIAVYSKLKQIEKKVE